MRIPEHPVFWPGFAQTARGEAAEVKAYAIAPQIAMYQRYGGGNRDEGCTRLMFEQVGLPFNALACPCETWLPCWTRSSSGLPDRRCG